MKRRTNQLVVASLLAAVAILIPTIMPPFLKVRIPPFTATLASHVPLIIAMFISPMAAAFTALASALGFLLSMTPDVAVRAAAHVFFVLAGAYMIKKKMNFLYVVSVTLLLHVASDMVAVIAYSAISGIQLFDPAALTATMILIGIGTSIHHIVDFIIAFFVVKVLKRANLLESDYPLPFSKG